MGAGPIYGICPYQPAGALDNPLEAQKTPNKGQSRKKDLGSLTIFFGIYRAIQGSSGLVGADAIYGPSAHLAVTKLGSVV